MRYLCYLGHFPDGGCSALCCLCCPQQHPWVSCVYRVQPAPACTLLGFRAHLLESDTKGGCLLCIPKASFSVLRPWAGPNPPNLAINHLKPAFVKSSQWPRCLFANGPSFHLGMMCFPSGRGNAGTAPAAQPLHRRAGCDSLPMGAALCGMGWAGGAGALWGCSPLCGHTLGEVAAMMRRRRRRKGSTPQWLGCRRHSPSRASPDLPVHCASPTARNGHWHQTDPSPEAN